MRRLQQKEVKREEAAPTFPAAKQRLEEKEQALRRETEQFLDMLKVLGTPMIEEPAVHFISYSPTAIVPQRSLSRSAGSLTSGPLLP